MEEPTLHFNNVGSYTSKTSGHPGTKEYAKSTTPPGIRSKILVPYLFVRMGFHPACFWNMRNCQYLVMYGTDLYPEPLCVPVRSFWSEVEVRLTVLSNFRGMQYKIYNEGCYGALPKTRLRRNPHCSWLSPYPASACFRASEPGHHLLLPDPYTDAHYTAFLPDH